MTNYAEEQELEVEALQSLFEVDKEFETISSTEFKIKLVPDPTGDTVNHVGLTLHITYTSEYPETAPEWEFEKIKGLPDPKTDELKAKVEELIQDSLGMAMVYMIAELCQDFLKDNNVKELSMHEQMMLREEAAAKGEGGDEDEDDEDGDEEDDYDDDNKDPGDEEWKGLALKDLCADSDRITVESFMAWKVNFDAEMVAAGVLKREENKAQTGKAWFLATRASEEKKAADDGDAAPEDGDVVYNAALFGEEADDLDDLDEDD